MDVNFELYKTFCCVARNKNISKSAEELYISQPAVTQLIKKLEDQIGYKLFFRTKNGVELTDEGTMLYDYLNISVEVLRNGKAKIKELKSEQDSIIKIGSGASLIKNNLLIPLTKFKKSFLEIKIEITQQTTPRLFEMLDNNLLDIIILNLPYKKNDNVVIKEIEDAQDILVASITNYNHYKDNKFSLKEINSLPLILQSNLSVKRQFLDDFFNKQHITLSPEYEFTAYGLVQDFIKEGIGVGFLNKNHIKKELADGSLFEIKTDFKIPSRKIGIAINKKTLSSKTIKKFVDFLTEQK